MATIADAVRPGAAERRFRIDGPIAGRHLFLRHLPARRATRAGCRRAVLYVHGLSFPSALSIAFRFDGRSWADHLADAGFDVWGLDFLGFGGSDRYAEMALPPARSAPLGRADLGVRQLELAVRFILREQGLGRLSLIAHSWGTMVAGRLAGDCPELIDRLALFGPLTERPAPEGGAPPALPGWRLLTAAEQYARFTEDVPRGEAPVLLRRHFDRWARAWLASDPAAAERDPPAVANPLGPLADVTAAWHGRLAYDPARVRAPVAILRGEWDSLSTDADAVWLQRALRQAAEVRDIKLARGTHLMHLEEGRARLHDAARDFLAAG
ncbi:MAG TPA: alpha/beta fold hydrolase [Candidatus Sulfotelmatobacter sp.]|nr:alpha/beta fold hydrolase [Candidatus Sulfotelmatobacter sp.]